MANVYTHTRLDKNEVFYVGIGSNDKSLERAHRKHGTEYWERIVTKTLYRVDILFIGISWDEAVEIEKYLIKFYGRRDLRTGTLVNMTDGGEGTCGRIRPLHEIEKFSGENNGSYGKSWIKRGEETKFVKRELLDEYFSEGWEKGRYIKQETKDKVSKGKKGKPLSALRKEQVRLQMTGHVKSDNERQKRSESLIKRGAPWHNVSGFKNMTIEEKAALKIQRLAERSERKREN